MPTPLFFPMDCAPLNEITKWVTDRAAEIESLQGEIKTLHARITNEAATNISLKKTIYDLQSKTQTNNEEWQS